MNGSKKALGGGNRGTGRRLQDPTARAVGLPYTNSAGRAWRRALTYLKGSQATASLSTEQHTLNISAAALLHKPPTRVRAGPLLRHTSRGGHAEGWGTTPHTLTRLHTVTLTSGQRGTGLPWLLDSGHVHDGTEGAKRAQRSLMVTRTARWSAFPSAARCRRPERTDSGTASARCGHHEHAL